MSTTDELLFSKLLDVSERSIEVSGQLKGKSEQAIREIQELTEKVLENSKKLETITRETHELWDWHNKADPDDPARKAWYTPAKLKDSLDAITSALTGLQSTVSALGNAGKTEETKSRAAFYGMWGTIVVAFLSLIGTIVALLL